MSVGSKCCEFKISIRNWDPRIVFAAWIERLFPLNCFCVWNFFVNCLTVSVFVSAVFCDGSHKTGGVRVSYCIEKNSKLKNDVVGLKKKKNRSHATWVNSRWFFTTIFLLFFFFFFKLMKDFFLFHLISSIPFNEFSVDSGWTRVILHHR